MLLHHSRRNTRVDNAGDLVLLEDQDRRAWDQAAIGQGRHYVESALRLGAAGPYTLQGAIVSVHADAVTFADTDWKQVVHLYDLLAVAAPSPVVGLNRAAAVAMRDGPEAGLTALTALPPDPQLIQHHLYWAAQADMLRRLGRREEAAAYYREALSRPQNLSERRYLERRLAEVTQH
jgi:RNA polymerase sigma-70 factor (ECF subfamily)